MRRTTLALMLALLVSPTWAAQKRQSASERIGAALDATNGQGADTAIETLGYPDDEKVIAGRKFFIWRASKSLHTPTGVIPLECVVRVVITEENTIDGWDIDGNAGACDIIANSVE